ncbi:N-methyl-L-tryptophan oxidase [Halalkalibacter okhensis]|uniref:N-methyl-L-tryptophan oxidase n=1 Tax=Halalkalibacter okhensis TaxID=333138 RepID=UPI0027E40E76|nr:N-methyl-L-tryptophan oxidase [Halalkalibacter okhensis]
MNGNGCWLLSIKKWKKNVIIRLFCPPHNKGSHHGETRIIRYAYGEGEEYVPFILRAKELWSDLEKRSRKQLFLRTGVINVGEETSDFIQNIIKSSKTYSLPVEIMNAKEVKDRWPGFSLPSNYVGCFEPTSGVLKCEESIQTYQELAEYYGATILTNSRVKSVSISNGKVKIKTDDNSYHSEALVVAAGAWSGELASMLGLELPLTPVRKSFAWFQADEKLHHQNTFPAFAFETSQGIYYGFPSIDGAGVKVGRHDGGDSINPDVRLLAFGEKETDKGDLVQFLNEYIPNVLQLNYGKTCMYTRTPDEKFIIDLHPNYSNVAIAAGFSGHGFKFSSAVGQALSNLIISGKNDVDISQFSIKRFN